MAEQLGQDVTAYAIFRSSGTPVQPNQPVLCTVERLTPSAVTTLASAVACTEIGSTRKYPYTIDAEDNDTRGTLLYTFTTTATNVDEALLYAEIEVGQAYLESISTIESAITQVLSRIGTFTGTGINTILGFLKAIMSKAASTPSDVGGTFSAATDALEAIQDGTLTASDVWSNGTRTLTAATSNVTLNFERTIPDIPQVNSYTVKSVYGDSYLYADGRSIGWEFTLAQCPLLASTDVVRLKVVDLSTGTTYFNITGTGIVDTRRVYFEPSGTNTAIGDNEQDYSINFEVSITRQGGSVITPIPATKGVWVVQRKVT